MPKRKRDHRIKIKFVNAYHIQQCYGGPEEGGWWYDAGEPLDSIRVGKYASLRRINAARRELKRRYYDDYAAGVNGRRAYYSVLSQGDLLIRAQSHAARPFPEQRPHYE